MIRGGVDGLRMAIARAERRALKRAFSALPTQTEDDEPNLELKESTGEVTTRAAVRSAPVSAGGGSGSSVRERQHAARRAYLDLDPDAADAFLRRHGIDDFGAPWPTSALDELLGRPAVEGAP